MLRPTMTLAARSRPTRPLVWPLIAVAIVIACQKNRDPETATPSDAASAGDAAPPSGASLESLEHELAQRNGELSQATDAKQAAMAGSTEGADVDHCERICSIAKSICGLADSICALADEHGGEPRYAESCTRATADCERANEACDACEG